MSKKISRNERNDYYWWKYRIWEARGGCAEQPRQGAQGLIWDYIIPNYNTSIIIDGMLIKVSICGNRETSIKDKTYFILEQGLFK